MKSGFLAMGGYAAYVWPCVGIALATLCWNVWSARRAQARALLRARRSIAMADA